jgi:hypothetical protein
MFRIQKFDKGLTYVPNVDKFRVCLKNDIARSSKGRTAVFGTVCGGSNPPRATLTKLKKGMFLQMHPFFFTLTLSTAFGTTSCNIRRTQ